MSFMNKRYNRIPFDLPDLQTIQTPEGRFYLTPDGAQYPSVTTVLYHRPNEGLEAWRKRVGEAEAARISEEATIHGDSVHAICESYLREEIETIKSFNPKQKHHLSVLRPILNNIDNIRGIELALWSHKLKMAGRSDLVADYKKVLSVCDWKTSRREKKVEHIQSYFVQGTAYSLMVEELTGVVIENIVIVVYVQATGKVQVFQDSRQKYIKPLMELVESYWSNP